MCAAALLAVVASWASAATTERVSVSSAGIEGDKESGIEAAVSGDGRYVAFMSRAGNLVPGDTNNAPDVFRRDRLTGETVRVSVSSAETQGDRISGLGIDISADGNLIVFGSRASNLVPRDTNRAPDVFVRNVAAGTTTRVSVTSNESQGDGGSLDPAISADGLRVAFVSQARLVRGDTHLQDVYVRLRDKGGTIRVSRSSGGVPGNGPSLEPDISGDGKVLAFSSRATNLVPGPDSNRTDRDVLVHRLESRRTSRESVDSDERQLRSSCRSPDAYEPRLNGNGRRVVFTLEGGIRCESIVYVRDRAGGNTVRVDVTPTGGFGNGMSLAVGISADGRHVLFHSLADNLVPDDTNGVPWLLYGVDAFVRDVVGGTTTRVSLSTANQEVDKDNWALAFSADGLHAVFGSGAANLVPADTNDTGDVFVRTLD